MGNNITIKKVIKGLSVYW